MSRPALRRFALLFALLAVPPIGLAEGLPDLGEASQADLPPAMERRIGQTALNEYRESSNFIDDAEITAYINELGNRLLAKSEAAGQDFQFFVLRDPVLNAFAMPGGFIGVHSGLIQAAQSESELAGVLAHEISHVTQHHLARLFGQQNKAQMPILLAMGVALLAGRNNPNLAMGGMAAAQAAGIQSQLSYSRDFEREADRLGISLLERSNFDIRGMESFFERLQKYGRLYETNAPGYLRTHPLTTERISDMDNRIQGKPYRQVADSFEFSLAKAKLRAYDGSARDAVADFAAQLREHKYASEAVVRYGLAHAKVRALDYAGAQREVDELRRLKAQSPMIESLAALVQQKRGDFAGAEKTLRQAMQHSHEPPLAYALTDTLLAAGKNEAALQVVDSNLQSYPSDARWQLLRAQVCSALGRHLQQHRAQAEAYALRGQWPQAVEQLTLAQKSPDGDFFEYSQVEARLRELKQKQADEAKQPLP